MNPKSGTPAPKLHRPRGTELRKSLTMYATIVACALNGATDAEASIPPPIAVKVVSVDLRTEAVSKAAVELLSAYDNFQWAQSTISRGGLIDCVKGQNAEACIRGLAARSPSPPPAVVLAEPGKGDVVKWTCLGGGSSPGPQPGQRITVDMKAALFGAAAQRKVLQAKLLRCIRLAAAEAHSGISAD
jgi:hypothetical protein